VNDPEISSSFQTPREFTVETMNEGDSAKSSVSDEDDIFPLSPELTNYIFSHSTSFKSTIPKEKKSFQMNIKPGIYAMKENTSSSQTDISLKNLDPPLPKLVPSKPILPNRIPPNQESSSSSSDSNDEYFSFDSDSEFDENTYDFGNEPDNDKDQLGVMKRETPRVPISSHTPSYPNIISLNYQNPPLGSPISSHPTPPYNTHPGLGSTVYTFNTVSLFKPFE